MSGGGILVGSCERMAELPDGSVRLIVTSPPYWNKPDDPLLGPALLRDRRSNAPDTFEGLLALLGRCFEECFRVLRPGRYCAVNVASTQVDGKLYALPYYFVPVMESIGWELRETFAWHRLHPWDRRAASLVSQPFPGYYYPNLAHEPVLLFRKPGGVPLRKDAASAAAREASRIPIDALYWHEVARNVWHIQPVQPAKRRGHPAPFPEELARRLISLYSFRDELVLDPFAGSGTTLKVANLLDRRYVGYEANPGYLPLIRERLRETGIATERLVCRFETLPEQAASHGENKASTGAP